jgi:hypothetical protein
MNVGKIFHLDEDDTSPAGSPPIVTINHVVDTITVPVAIHQGSETVWFGRQQARDLCQALAEELGEDFLGGHNHKHGVLVK